MSGLAAILLIHGMVVEHQPQKYHEAYDKALKNGRPLLVIIGAEWCPACRELKDETVPKALQNGGLNGIEVAFVDSDNDAIAKKLQKGTRIPQIIRYERTGDRWGSDRLVGRHDGASLLKFAQGGKRGGKSLLTSRKKR